MKIVSASWLAAASKPNESEWRQPFGSTGAFSKEQMSQITARAARRMRSEYRFLPFSFGRELHSSHKVAQWQCWCVSLSAKLLMRIREQNVLMWRGELARDVVKRIYSAFGTRCIESINLTFRKECGKIRVGWEIGRPIVGHLGARWRTKPIEKSLHSSFELFINQWCVHHRRRHIERKTHTKQPQTVSICCGCRLPIHDI